jgi:hypothetical protein
MMLYIPGKGRGTWPRAGVPADRTEHHCWRLEQVADHIRLLAKKVEYQAESECLDGELLEVLVFLGP